MRSRGKRAGLIVVTSLACLSAALWWMSVNAPGGVVWTAAGVAWESMRSPKRPTAVWLADNVSLSVRDQALFFVINRTPAGVFSTPEWRGGEVMGFEYSQARAGRQKAPYLRLVRVPLSVVTLLLAAWPLCAFANRFRRRPDDAGHCSGCGYDLTGNVSGVCPECGRTAE